MSQSPDSSQNPFAGMNWWNGGGFQGLTDNLDSGSLQRQIDQIKATLVQHFNTDLWNSRLEYPHPNQRVNTLYFFDGNGRLNNSGFQILNSDFANQRGIYWVGQFDEFPFTNTPTRAQVTGYATYNALA